MCLANACGMVFVGIVVCVFSGWWICSFGVIVRYRLVWVAVLRFGCGVDLRLLCIRHSWVCRGVVWLNYLFGRVLCDCCDGGFRICVFVLVVVLIGFSCCFWFTLVGFGGIVCLVAVVCVNSVG